jgi:hypothetical protein
MVADMKFFTGQNYVGRRSSIRRTHGFIASFFPFSFVSELDTFDISYIESGTNYTPIPSIYTQHGTTKANCAASEDTFL